MAISETETRKLTIQDKLGHILVQVLLLDNNGQSATQTKIKKELAGRRDAPTIKNIDHPLRYLLELKDPRRTLLRPQTNRPWLGVKGRELYFLKREKVLSDYRACAGLLFALKTSVYTGSHYAFSIKDLGNFLKEDFQVDNKLLKLILGDFRICEYTLKSADDPLKEQIFPDFVNRESFYLQIAAQNNTLVKDYSKR